MRDRSAITEVANTAQRWLDNRREIDEMIYRAQILNSEAEGLEAEANRDRRAKLKAAKKNDELLQELKNREKEIKAGDQIADATKKLFDLKETTGLNETTDRKKEREGEIETTVYDDEDVQRLTERAAERRAEAETLTNDAEKRKQEAVHDSETIIEQVANLGQLPLF